MEGEFLENLPKYALLSDRLNMILLVYLCHIVSVVLVIVKIIVLSGE